MEQWKDMKQQWRCSGKRKEGTKLNLPPKLVENLVWVPVIFICKISIWGPHYVETGRSQQVKFCIVNHDIFSGWQLWRFSEFFLVFRTCLFWFLYPTPMREIYINVVKSSFSKLVLDIPIVRKEVYWPLTFTDEKTNFTQILPLGKASFLLLVPQTRTGWLLYDAQEHPHPHVEAQALRGVYYQTFGIHSKSQQIKNSFKISTRTWGRGCTGGRYIFSQMPH